MSKSRVLPDVEQLSVRIGQAIFVVRTGMEIGPGDQVSRFAAVYEPQGAVARATWRLVITGHALALAEEAGKPLTLEALARVTLPRMISWLEAELERPRVELGDERRWLGPAEL